jgi:peptidoglycan/LPS O-acetylase OafA/YrhL
MKERLENIQALRGVAALMVLFAHVKEAEGDYGGAGALLPYSFYMGVIGVDLFFLISGFVMVHVTLGTVRGPDAAQRFIFNRASRIYPAYWAVTLILMALYAGKQALFAEPTPFPNPVETFLLLPDDHYPLLPVGWTLVHEMYFYVVFTIFVAWRRVSLPAFLVGWTAILIAAQVLGLVNANAWTRIAFSPLTFEFIAGACVALLIRRGFTRFATAAILAGVAIIAIETFFFAGFFYPEVMGDFARRAVSFAPAFVLILYGAAALEREGLGRAPLWLRRTGDASYSMYLIHVPVFLVVGKLLSITLPDSAFDNIALIAAFFASAIFAAFALHYFVEKPLLSAARRLGERVRATRTAMPAA